MIWFDTLLLVVIGISAIISLMRGFVREVLSLVGWISAFFVAKYFYLPLSTQLVNTISRDFLRESIAWVSLFFFTLMLSGMLNYMVGRVVTRAGLSGMDRTMGMVFGACRGVFVSVLLILSMMFFTNFHRDAWWQESKMVPQLQVLGEWFANHLDEDFYQDFKSRQGVREAIVQETKE